jgi:SAM-dependent methyltransferase
MTLTLHTDPKEAQRELVRRRYAQTAREGEGCCEGSCSAEYSPEELAQIPPQAVLGLGSGNPVRAANIEPGETVLDLGCGAGIDVFLCASVVGPEGRAIGVDMTPEMLARARAAAVARGSQNVEFREGILEALPVDDASVDAVISNCVINLSPDKAAVFREAFRVLRPGGRLVVSDIVLDRPLRAPASCGCVDTADLREVYLDKVARAGFQSVQVLDARPWSHEGEAPVAFSVTVHARKPAEVRN